MILLWCIVPLCSAIVNGLSVGSGLVGSAYFFLAWIVPYFSGRLFSRDQESLCLLAHAIAAAGLLYIPIGILEVFTGPQVYFHIYGYEPFQWIGARRYFGLRPIGFLEDGNQLGVWMAPSALVAFSLWAHRSVGRILGIPAKWAALSLAAITLLCQSAGSILLFVFLLPLVMKSPPQSNTSDDRDSPRRNCPVHNLAAYAFRFLACDCPFQSCCTCNRKWLKEIWTRVLRVAA